MNPIERLYATSPRPKLQLDQCITSGSLDRPDEYRITSYTLGKLHFRKGMELANLRRRRSMSRGRSIYKIGAIRSLESELLKHGEETLMKKRTEYHCI